MIGHYKGAKEDPGEARHLLVFNQRSTGTSPVVAWRGQDPW
jgi:hypothetical protein